MGVTLDCIPAPIAGVEVELVEGEYLMYQPRFSRAIYLNPTAALIWSLCDGVRPLREIVELIRAGYPDAPPDLAKDIVDVVARLEEHGALAVT